jgi:tetratricopeptide (TPR) repeat protein
MANEERTVVAKNRSVEVSALAKLFRGDLDWIAMKCLEKDRTRRYKTASGLAADIQRHLSNEPVVARPPSAAYKLQKAWQRNKLVFTAGAVVAVTLVAGIIGTTLGLIALQTANEHEHLLNERARQAIESVASETAIEQLTRQKELSPEQKEFLDKMIQYYAESTQDQAATEEERTRQARAYHRMGRLNQILDRSEDSENAYRRAVALFQQLAADFPTRPEFRQELASSQNTLGVLLLATGRLTEAESAYIAGLAILKQLAADFPADPILRRALAISHNCLGWLFQDTKRLEKAESAFRDALPLQKQAVAEFPNRSEFRQELAEREGQKPQPVTGVRGLQEGGAELETTVKKN